MRMLVLAGAVTVAVVVAVVVVGLRLTGDDDPKWAARATGICERGLTRARDALGAESRSARTRSAPSTSTRARPRSRPT